LTDEASKEYQYRKKYIDSFNGRNVLQESLGVSSYSMRLCTTDMQEHTGSSFGTFHNFASREHLNFDVQTQKYHTRNKPILRFKATPAETTRTQTPSHAEEAPAAVSETIPD
jgi:hypothetical protein